jgi:hypothetical protein
MTNMWGEIAPQMMDRWSQSVTQMMEQSAAFRSQVDRAVTEMLEAWGASRDPDSASVQERMKQLVDQVEHLTARIDQLEGRLAAGNPESEPPR